MSGHEAIRRRLLVEAKRLREAAGRERSQGSELARAFGAGAIQSQAGEALLLAVRAGAASELLPLVRWVERGGRTQERIGGVRLPAPPTDGQRSQGAITLPEPCNALGIAAGCEIPSIGWKPPRNGTAALRADIMARGEAPDEEIGREASAFDLEAKALLLEQVALAFQPCTQADDLMPPGWFQISTDGKLTASNLRRSIGRLRPGEWSRSGGRIMLSVEGVCRVWPAHRREIRDALERHRQKK